MAYATLAQVRDALRLPADDESLDATIERVLDSATAEVNTICRRTFDLDGSASARLVVASRPSMLLVDDIGDVGSIAVETRSGSAWTAVDSGAYQAEPLNGMRNSEPWPVMWLVALGSSWPVGAQASVRVTAKWGWPAVPAPIVEATILMAVRTLKRPDAPFGVTFGELGALQLQSSDPDVLAKLAPYEKVGGIG